MADQLTATDRQTSVRVSASLNGNGSPYARLERPTVRGKFLFAGDEKLYVRGVTYGPFGSRDERWDGFDPRVAGRDFERMRAHGINAVRLYGLPPRWLLDLAMSHGLRAMVGIPWEQHVAFLDDARRRRSIVERVRAGIRACAGHPAVLCYAIGNEIPAPIVRWHGARRIERFVGTLYDAAKTEDPDGLVTYVNYPSTEYLRLPFLDLACFNVYLEDRERLTSYLARLQNLADDRPLVMAEMGLDSRRNGEQAQADTVDWQLRETFAAGCAGAFVFAWTDQWHRGGHEILDWDFGLTTRSRGSKPSLEAASHAFADAPLRVPEAPPKVSVVVCTYNGAATLGACLDGVHRLTYANREVIVVSDGSTDASPQIAAEHEARLIETPNRGLSAARNTGLAAATGEIVAYLDDDARPDPDWLTFLEHAFRTTDCAGIGGPNVLPCGSCGVAACVANAPGGPTHVLLSDREAEHIPGCNMAFRRDALEAVGGFDPRFRVAGDDVDLCWRLQDAGFKLGFAPGAVVWHHRRRSVRGYICQQRGYGRAEAMLERKWPERYSPAGHARWSGRLYGNGSAQHRGGWRWRVYYGTWGTGAFQSVYGPRNGLLESLPLMPEWYLAIAILGLLVAGTPLWHPLLIALPFLGVAIGALLFDAALGATRASFPASERRGRRLRLRVLTAILYLLQPLARLCGRLPCGLTPVRRRGPPSSRLPVPGSAALWSEQWRGVHERVRDVADALRADGSIVAAGGDWDRFDLHVRGGSLGGARLLVAIEEHGSGRQLVRVRWWPCVSPMVAGLATLAAALAVAALAGHAVTAASVLGAVALLAALRLAYECGAATATIERAVARRRHAPRALATLAPVEEP